jgi:predicted ester cyclase
MSEENKAVIRRLVEQVWNRRTLDAADELFAPEAIVYESGVPLPGVGPAVIKEAMGALWVAYPDIRTTVDDMIAAEDKVVVRWSAVGTHQGVVQGIAPTNRKVAQNGIVIYRLAAGKIVEEWMNTNLLGILKQLGVVP